LSWIVIAGLVPAIHALLCPKKDVDGRDDPGHDYSEGMNLRTHSKGPKNVTENPDGPRRHQEAAEISHRGGGQPQSARWPLH
jgi:hypothetical protein